MNIEDISYHVNAEIDEIIERMKNDDECWGALYYFTDSEVGELDNGEIEDLLTGGKIKTSGISAHTDTDAPHKNFGISEKENFMRLIGQLEALHDLYITING
jgi:hypothetical protein